MCFIILMNGYGQILFNGLRTIDCLFKDPPFYIVILTLWVPHKHMKQKGTTSHVFYNTARGQIILSILYNEFNFTSAPQVCVWKGNVDMYVFTQPTLVIYN